MASEVVIDRLHSRAKSLADQFERGGESRCIEEAIDLARQALELCPSGHPMRSVSLTWLALHLGTRYSRLGDIEDINEAIPLDREALLLRPPGHSDRSLSLSNLGSHLSSRYRRLGGLDDLDESITLGRDMLLLHPPGHPDRSVSLNNLGAYLSSRYNRFGRLDDLDEAIMLGRDTLLLRPPGHPLRSTSLNNLGSRLSSRYDLLGRLGDLDETVTLGRDALLLCPPGHPDRSMSLNNLGSYLSSRYQRLGGLDDLDKAIALGREALPLCPPGHPYRSVSLSNLGSYLSSHYKRLGVLDDLDEAITLGRDALLLCPLGHPDRSTSLNNLGSYLSSRYNQLGRLNDLNKTITLGREALLLRPLGHPDRSMSLNNLSICLSSRYNRLGRLDDLNEAIALGHDAILLRPPGHPLRSTSLNNLGSYLSSRYNRLGIVDDLDKAIMLARDALLLCPPGHPDRSTPLNNLGSYLSSRYSQLGGLDDLDEAITLGREALLLCPPGHPHRSMSLNNLGSYLSSRYGQLGGLNDLGEAITLCREALLLRPLGHPLRSTSLNNLGSYLFSRYKRPGGLNDLDEAITLCREALLLRPPGHPDRSSSLNNLATYLSSHYNRLGRLEDLDEAITLCREALLLCPPGNILRSTSLNNLGSYLSSRYSQLGGLNDLDEAIVLGRDALLLCPPGHPRRPQSLHSLASRLNIRHTKLQHDGDEEELFATYLQLSDVQQTTSLDDFSAARAWITAAEHSRHTSTLVAYQTALRFLTYHLATLPALPQHLANVKNIASSLAVDAFSAGIRNHDLARAAELLEQGRGIFWGQLVRLDSSHEVADVAASGSAGKGLADEFTRVSSLIRSAISSPDPSQHDQVCNLNVKLQVIISEIRRLPHLSRFLLPPAFLDLQQAASGGPIIIVNASAYSCDALIVLADRDPIHVPLSAVTREGALYLSSRLRTLTVRAKSASMLQEFGTFLRELWDHVVSPIVDVLRTVLPFQSRIWWCPTAEFTLLPFHAAGPCRLGEQNLPDLYVSSYTPTLSALIRARRHVQLKTERISGFGHGPGPIPLRKQDSNSLNSERSSLSKRECHTPVFNLFSSTRFRRHNLSLPSPPEAKKRSFPSNFNPNLSDAVETQTEISQNRNQAGSNSGGEYVPVSSKPNIVVYLNPTGRLQQTRFVAIGQANAAGEKELKSVANELTDIGQLLDGLAAFTRIEGPESSISRTIDEFGKNEWVHLPCHGIPNEEYPFDSAFALHDGHLTIERIIRCELENPEFAFLSACHTTVGDKESPDEVLHLAAAVQFVGFRSVIGTMWAVDDGQAGKITSTFYRHLIGDSRHLDYTRAALALNLTMKELTGIVPGDQRVLYVHIGV